MLFDQLFPFVKLLSFDQLVASARLLLWFDKLIAPGREIMHFYQMASTDLLLFMVLGTISILKHIVTYGLFF